MRFSAALGCISLSILTYVATARAEIPAKTNEAAINQGRYLATVAGCNDCHTSGFAPAGGTIPEADWLMGDAIGWRGPWGTTYPINLRIFMQNLSEEQWIAVARNSKARPPMPSYVLNQMKEEDLKALYQFIRSLGAKGESAPVYVAPDQEPNTPYFSFVPVQPKTKK